MIETSFSYTFLKIILIPVILRNNFCWLSLTIRGFKSTKEAIPGTHDVHGIIILYVEHDITMF